MPLVASSFKPAWYLRNADLQTILPALFRNVGGIHFSRERITTPDEDFLDVDWIHHPSKKVALLIHGLEASTKSNYIKGMAKTLHHNGWNVAAMNLRGITHERHQLRRTYHSGATEDVDIVIKHLLNKNRFIEMALIGFSLGGNLVVKYTGECGEQIDSRIKKAIGISVPCDLNSTAYHLDSSAKKIYRNRFLRSLKGKLIGLRQRLPFQLSEKEVRNIKTLVEYDDRFTAPMYGFKNAEDYYEQCSSKKFIAGVKIPLLILTAKDDPFFTHESLPFDECTHHPLVQLETPDYGGHVGFMITHPWGKYYSEVRTLQFLGS